ncbi:signal peptidase II [Methylacidimicrobium cyclopophantes]|uniref:Lipoprotein signal peptidase n=1 Tax=Methylacidimicrobium cyclopophantes TaxID=1041766 RepID=A0A5E6MAQ8_9BACT|nr:signal peptidase II [Methylacidimicrobium cyclopophantes]VVM05409.1 signal peptidase II [Methylacidimicrobium cyclopophantes]
MIPLLRSKQSSSNVLFPEGRERRTPSSGPDASCRRLPGPLYWGLLLGLFLLDQGTKTLILRQGENFPLSLLPGFLNLVSVQNTGIIFGLFAGQNWLWIGIGSFILLAGLWASRSVDWSSRETNVIAALLTAGAAGNISDRIAHGFVVDFIDVYVGSWHWPSFNVADSCLCIASLWMIFRFALARAR